MSLRAEGSYRRGDVEPLQKRTFITSTLPVSIDAPVPIRGLILINRGDQPAQVNTDNGDVFPVPGLVICTYSLPPTLRLTARYVTAPTNGLNCNVIATDEPTLNSTSQLVTLAPRPASSGGGSSAGPVSGPPLVTAFPGSPVDTQEVILVDSVLAPTWGQTCQYVAALGAWLVTGPQWIEGTTSVTVPRAGSYMCMIGAESISVGADANIQMVMTAGGISLAAFGGTAGGGTEGALFSVMDMGVMTGLTQGQVLTPTNSGTILTPARAYIRLLPRLLT